MDDSLIQVYADIPYESVNPEHWDLTWEEILEILDRRYRPIE